MSIYVIGGGGHAKVVIATLRAAGEAVAGVVDDDPAMRGRTLLGVPVLGTREEVGGVIRRAVIAVGSNAIRKRIAEALPDVEWVTAIHPAAAVHASVQLGGGTVVFAGAVIQPDTRIGAHGIVNTGATLDHDCELSDYVHVAPGGHLAGNVRAGEGAFFGIGSAAAPGVSVGAWTTVGAGGVVVRDLPGHVTAVGVPAKSMR